MSDNDRGAYTPGGGERPLAFDARRGGGGGGGGGGRAPAPWTLIGSAGVLLVVVIGLVLAYARRDHAADTPKPVGAPVGAIKTAAPDAPAEAATPGMGAYAVQNVPASKPNFAPPPETPAPRPAPKGLTVRTVDPAKVRIESAEANPPPADKLATTTAATTLKLGAADAPAPKPVASRPVQIAAATPAKASPTKAVAAATPTPAAAASAKAATTTAATTLKPVSNAPAAAAAGGAVVQIGAFSSRALADKGWADATAASGGAGKHGKAVVEVDKDGKTLFRTSVTGFADRAAAKAWCDALSAKGHSCIVKG